MFCNANCLSSHHRRSQGWEALDWRAVSDREWLLHSIQGHLTSRNYPLLRWWRGHLESWTKGAPWNFLFSIWTPTWMSYLLSKGREAKGPFLADINIKLHHCLQLTGYWHVWTTWTHGETGGKKVWADGSKCSECSPASHLSGLLNWRKQCCLREVLRDQIPPPPLLSLSFSPPSPFLALLGSDPGVDKTLTKTQCPSHFRAQSKHW